MVNVGAKARVFSAADRHRIHAAIDRLLDPGVDPVERAYAYEKAENSQDQARR